MDGSGSISFGSTLLLWVDPEHPALDEPDLTVASFSDVRSAVDEALSIIPDQGEDLGKIPIIFYHDFETGSDDSMTLFDAIHKHLPKH